MSQPHAHFEESVELQGRSDFDIATARRLVSDLMEPNPWIYWTDFLVSLGVGYAAAGVYLHDTTVWWLRLLCFVVSGFALYRVGTYMHEIVHFRRDQMPVFKVVWNLVAGIPLLTPSFFYAVHIGHHNTRHYGTRNDGEYLPLGNGPLRDVFLFLAQMFILPLQVVVRFTILGPISFLHPRLRQWVLEHASSFCINFRHKREIPPDAPRLEWALMDLACCLRAWLIFIFVFAELTPWWRIPLLYLLAAFVLGMNHFRTLLAHRYLGDGQTMSHRDQFFDSTNISGGWLTELLCPLGLRYHALHHLFPSMPYHNLGIAHRRLMAQLPENSAYRDVLYANTWAVLSELVGNVREARRQSYQRSRRWYAGRPGAGAEPASERSARVEGG